MEILNKRKELIISPVNIGDSCIKRIDQFCKLLRLKLNDHWMVSEDSQGDCDVLIKKYDPKSIKAHNDKIPTIYLVYHEEKPEIKKQVHNMWLLHYPIFSHTLVPLLNEVSKQIRKPVTTNSKKDISTTFKERFSKFLRSPFKQKNDEVAKAEAESTEQKVAQQTSQKKYVNNLLKYFKPSEKLNAKIVFLGRPGSGKTTAIVGVSKNPALTTEVKATDHVGLIKSNTTIGIDYGEFENDAIKLKLYGTPGQQRYDYMRQLVINNVDAYVVLIDLSSENPLAEVTYFNNIIKLNSGSNAKILFAFTHRDVGVHNPEHIAKQMRSSTSNSIITVMDPRDQKSVKQVLEKLAEALVENDFFSLSQTEQEVYQA